MMNKKFVVGFVFGLVLVFFGCVNYQQKFFYGWGNYQDQLYEYFKIEGNGNVVEIVVFEENLQKMCVNNDVVFFGYYVYLGMLYVFIGKED